MQQPVIRRARPDEAQIVAEIGARTFVETFAHLYPPEDLATFLDSAYDVEQTRADLADPAKAHWLVEADGQIVGYALAGPCGLPHPEVTPASGELKLFQDIMAWLLADGPRDLWIGVWSENYGAQRFYERQGFMQVGEYGFQVGSTTDREFILRRDAGYSTQTGESLT